MLVDPEVDVGGRVLVRGEARAAGQLEVDLVLEQDHRLPGACGEQPEQARAREQRGEPLVIGHEVLDARQHPGLRIAPAPLVVAHPLPGHLGPGGDLVGPAYQVARHLRAEKPAQPEPAMPRPVLPGRPVEHARPLSRRPGRDQGPPGYHFSYWTARRS